MKAIQVSSFGAPEVPRLAELPDPAPGPGEVAIDVTHAAVGLIDVFIRQGLYRHRPGLPQPPYVPGLEVAGTVCALGEGVCRIRGRRARGDLTGQQPAGGYAAIGARFVRALECQSRSVTVSRSGASPGSRCSSVSGIARSPSGPWAPARQS